MPVMDIRPSPLCSSRVCRRYATPCCCASMQVGIVQHVHAPKLWHSAGYTTRSSALERIADSRTIAHASACTKRATGAAARSGGEVRFASSNKGTLRVPRRLLLACKARPLAERHDAAAVRATLLRCCRSCALELAGAPPASGGLWWFKVPAPTEAVRVRRQTHVQERRRPAEATGRRMQSADCRGCSKAPCSESRNEISPGWAASGLWQRQPPQQAGQVGGRVRACTPAGCRREAMSARDPWPC